MAGTLAVEAAIFIGGVLLYTRVTRPKNRVGLYSWWGLIVFLIMVYFVNAFGPPPPNVQAIAWAGQLQWLLVAWAYWTDRNRTTIAPAS
jgi:hypothetical protein